MLSDYQLKIADHYNMPIGNVIIMWFIRIETKKDTSCIRIQSQWLKPCVEFNTQKRIETEKNGGKDEKVLYKSVNNGVYGITMEKLEIIDLENLENIEMELM